MHLNYTTVWLIHLGITVPMSELDWPGPDLFILVLSKCCNIRSLILHYICCYVGITIHMKNILLVKYLEHCNFMLFQLQDLLFVVEFFSLILIVLDLPCALS